MSNLWERFDSMVNAEEVLEAKSSFAPIPAGEYDVTLEEMEAGESKNGLPMLKGKFRTDANRIVFYNQTLQNLNNPEMTAKNVAQANSFINDLTGEEVDFTTLGALAERVATMELGGRYKIKLSYADKDTEMKFPKLSIVKKVDLDKALAESDIPDFLK